MTRQSLQTRQTARERDNRYEQFISSFAEPYPINPFRVLRMGKALTLTNLAVLCNLSKQTLIRAEQGLFDEPPVKLMEYWLKHGENELDLRDRYHDFQLSVRSRHARLFGNSLGKVGHESGDLHPLEWLLTQWVAGQPMNLMECAKLLCVSQPLLNNWIKNPRQLTVPKPLQSALLQNGYSRREIKVFVGAYDTYRKGLQLK